MTDSPLLAAARAPRRASVGFMVAHPAHLIALGFGAGLSPIAPGTVGTLWAWLSFLALSLVLDPAGWGWLIAVGVPVCWWSSTVTARNLGVADPSAIVVDEIVAFWAVLWLVMPVGFWGQLIAFTLFRFFDAAKPWPVAWADARFKLRPGEHIGWRQGFGIVLDDGVAALCTLLVMAIWLRLP